MTMKKTQTIEASCPALTNENYEYHLSGDAADYCICSITGNGCFGRVISDPEDRSSQFFSRGKCSIDSEKIKKCPLYGVSKETFVLIIKDRTEKELNEKLNNLNK